MTSPSRQLGGCQVQPNAGNGAVLVKSKWLHDSLTKAFSVTPPSPVVEHQEAFKMPEHRWRAVA